MSKAFVKEAEGEEEGDDLPTLPVQAQGKNYITPLGAQRLRDELKQLLDVERPTIVKTVSWAASNGDRSENGDYLYGKKKLREIDKRIRFLTKRIEAFVEVEPSLQKADRVLFGATVVVEDEGGRKRCLKIVGIDEADASKGLLSWISPMAQALFNAKPGDVVTMKTPKGPEDIEVLELRYE